jgi:cell division septation protein DedD
VVNEKTKSMELAQKKIKSNVQKATFNVGSLTKMNLSFNAKPEVIEIAPLDRTYYSVVAGSFRSIDNAERLLKNLRVNGFDAAFTEVNPQGLHRVAYGRFISKREALNLHNYVKFALKEDAWFLVEK